LKGNPQFSWVREVLRKFPHPPNWQHVDRNSDGTYRNFPGGTKANLVEGLKRFADNLTEQGYSEEAEQVNILLRREDE